MKILILDPFQKSSKSLEGSLSNWGFEVQTLADESLLAMTLQQDSEFRCVLFYEVETNLPHLLHISQGQENYRYCILLHSATFNLEEEASLMELGVDQLMPSVIPAKLLHAKLLTAERLVNQTLLQSSNKFKVNDQDLQVIDLDLGLEYVSGDRALFYDLIRILLENTENLQVNKETFQSFVWDELNQTISTLGTNELSGWLTGLLQLKQESSDLDTSQFQVLQAQLQGILRRMRDAVLSLERVGYFVVQSDEAENNYLQGAKVLLVEDMPHNRILVRQILKPHKPEIIEAINGEDAVEKWVACRPFDVIMMDMNMPIMDGFAATKKIRRLEKEQGLPSTPILALTALAMRGDQEKCLEAGCDGYIPKPVDPRNLLSVANDLIGDQKLLACEIPTKQFLNIHQVGIVTKNQVYYHSVHLALKNYGVDSTLLESRDTVLEKIEEGGFELIILDIHKSLDLALYIKTQYPHQAISLICPEDQEGKFLLNNLPQVIQYPLVLDKVLSVLDYHSKQLHDAKKFQNIVEDFDALTGVKGQTSIEESVEKSDQQLAVWQKAFRKIGGDLVLSHNFNLHGKFGFIMADVSGHDIQSGYTASWFAGLVKGVWAEYPMPLGLLTHLNGLFSKTIEEGDRRYVCALALLWDPMRKTLHYANAGIPGGILLKQGKSDMEVINWQGAPVGMFPEMAMFDAGHISFQEGDRLVLATDGVLESIPDNVVASLSVAKEGKVAQKTLDGLVDFIIRSMEIHDDLTIAVFDAKYPEIAKGGYRSHILSTMEATYDEVKRLQEYVERVAPDTFDWPMISVAIKEALINAVEHGNKGHEGSPVDIDAEINEENNLVVRVSDCGSGFDVNREKRRIEGEGQLRIQGRGVILMEHVAKSVEFSGGGVSLVFAPEGDEVQG